MTLLLSILSWIFGHLPLRLAHVLGRGIGFLAWLITPRKAEVRERISDCLGVNDREAGRIQRRMYRNLGWTVAEFLRLPRVSEEELREQMTFVHADRLPDNNQYIAVVAHTGNWEYLAAVPPLMGYGRLHIVVKTLKPEKLNDWVCRGRSRWGTKVHDRRGASRNLLRVLKKGGEPLGFIMDQNAKNNWGVYVDFFGKPACTTDGLAQLAAISGYEIHPVFCRRDMKTRKLIVEVGEQIESPKDRSSEEIKRVTAACTKCIEDFLRQYPDQWIWMHRRWKTKPPETEKADSL